MTHVLTEYTLNRVLRFLTPSGVLLRLKERVDVHSGTGQVRLRILLIYELVVAQGGSIN